MVPRQWVAAGVWRGWEDLKLTHPSLLSVRSAGCGWTVGIILVRPFPLLSLFYSFSVLFCSHYHSFSHKLRGFAPCIHNCQVFISRQMYLSVYTYICATATWVKIARKIKEREKEGGRILLSKKKKRSLPLLTKLLIDLKSSSNWSSKWLCQ